MDSEIRLSINEKDSYVAAYDFLEATHILLNITGLIK